MKTTFRRCQMSDILGLTNNNKETFEFNRDEWNSIGIVSNITSKQKLNIVRYPANVIDGPYPFIATDPVKAFQLLLFNDHNGDTDDNIPSETLVRMDQDYDGLNEYEKQLLYSAKK